jgi:sulfide dehydrogenase [flavocytochrome c] flavoprotein chain
MINRRQFVQGLTATGGLLMLPGPALSQNAKPRLVVIGGGAGGAAFIRAIRAQVPDAFDITLVTSQKFYNAPFALNGIPQQKSGPCDTATIDLVAAFERQAVKVVVGRVETIDLDNNTIGLSGNEAANLSYDVLVAAPGVALNWGAFGLEGTPDTSAIWTSDASCQNLLSQLQKVPMGGTFALVAPAGHNRCPPAVYERACRAARWFNSFDKTAKILIIDEKDEYPMQAMFEEAYADYYDGMIEWIPRDFHGGVTSVDLEKNNIQTDSELFEADVVNAIPPQRAPDFLTSAGMAADDGYCAIRTPSMQSAIDKNVYVIGDAAGADEMSKSASSAVVEARLAAVDIITRFSKLAPSDTVEIADKCWTLVAPDDAISLGGKYRATGIGFASDQRFMSTVEDSAAMRNLDARIAEKWPSNILQSLYGS